MTTSHIDMKKFTLTLLTIFLFSGLVGQNSDHTPLMFIYDASGSMWGQIDGKTKMQIASEVLSNSIESLPASQSFGLVAYGHRSKGDCEDVEVLAELSNKDKSATITAINGLTPLGKTPLAYSALQVIDELRTSGKTANIILITDGVESCGGDLCEVIKQAKAEGIEFRLHIVGFGLSEDKTEALKCAAAAGEGNYYEAQNADDLNDVLSDAASVEIVKPEHNFTGYALKNGKAIDAVFAAYDVKSKREVRGARSYRDTAQMYLPPSTYNIEVRPLEGSDVDQIVLTNVAITENGVEHRTVSFDAAKILVNTTNNGEPWDCTARLKDVSTGRNVATARTYGKTKTMEVSPGTYTLTLEALEIKGMAIRNVMENITIEAGATLELGHDFKSGIAMIGAVSGEDLVDCTVQIAEKESGTGVAARRTYTSSNNNPKKFILNPGTYEVTLKALGAHSGEQTFTMTINAGETFEKIVTF